MKPIKPNLSKYLQHGGRSERTNFIWRKRLQEPWPLWDQSLTKKIIEKYFFSIFHVSHVYLSCFFSITNKRNVMSSGNILRIRGIKRLEQFEGGQSLRGNYCLWGILLTSIFKGEFTWYYKKENLKNSKLIFDMILWFHTMQTWHRSIGMLKIFLFRHQIIEYFYEIYIKNILEAKSLPFMEKFSLQDQRKREREREREIERELK